jgi:hypothetical protein
MHVGNNDNCIAALRGTIYLSRRLVLVLLFCWAVLLDVAAGWAFADFRFDSDGWCTHPRRFTCQNQEFIMRNVPGDGDCLFTAVLSAAAHGMGLDFQLPVSLPSSSSATGSSGSGSSSTSSSSRRMLSKTTREIVATILQTPGTLWIGSEKSVSSHQLLRSAARELQVTPSAYLQFLRTPGVDGGLYGGGPELTVLSNWLRREIAIYEIDEQQQREEDESSHLENSHQSPLEATTNNHHNHTLLEQSMILRGIFGENVFADRLPPDSAVRHVPLDGHDWRIHILIVDTNPSEKHACVLLPVASRSRKIKRRMEDVEAAD